MCHQDKALTQDNIYVDKLLKNKTCFLTHAHRDHFGNITASFQGVIYCTRVTMQLLQNRVALPDAVFRVLHYYKWRRVGKWRVMAISAFHCDGSAMFAFMGKTSGRTILYTGDFRWMNQKLGTFDTIYYDDTFSQFAHVPSLRHTFKDCVSLIEDLFKQYSQIVIHAKVLGFEIILRALVTLGIIKGFQVTPHLSARVADFKLLDVPIIETSRIILGSRHQDNLPDLPWIVPSFTSQICPLRNDKNRANKLLYPLAFATHAGKDEIEKLKGKELIACNFAITCDK